MVISFSLNPLIRKDTCLVSRIISSHPVFEARHYNTPKVESLPYISTIDILPEMKRANTGTIQF